MRWQEFFEHEADRYDDEPFTKATEREIEFLIEQFRLPRGARMVGRAEEASTFDVMAQTTLNTMVFETARGPVEIPCRERMYTPTEFSLMLRAAGFSVEHVWGGTAGNWRRGPMDLDEYELMAVARKT